MSQNYNIWYSSAMIAAYVRVSSKAQTLKTQKDAILRVCKARRERIAVWFEERVSSQNERPQLNALREFIRGGGARKLYVFRLDRLTRGGACEMLNLMNEFKTHGCEVESIADGFGFSGPAREIVFAVLGMCAELERAAIAERVTAARRRIEAGGGTWGRPSTVTDKQRQQIRKMAASDWSIRSIAEEIGLAPSTVHRILSQKPTPKSSVSKVKKKPLSGVAFAPSH
jgi:putative DNA-invertase from lambdoid prophage Rac